MPKEHKRWYEIRGKQNGETEISIDDEIGAFGLSAKAFRDDIKRLGEKEALHVHINSDGGDITEGNEIFNILRDHKGPVRTSVGAIAASMATVIAAAGKPCSIAENGFYMIHNPWTITMGDSEELRKNAEVMDKMKAGIIAAYRQKSHLSEQEISDLMDEETWMTAEEALENGFVDSIDKNQDDSAKNFDLSRYRNSASFLSRLQHEHKARGKRAPKPGTEEGKVTLQDLENAIHPDDEPPPKQQQTTQQIFTPRNQIQMTPEELAAEKAKAEKEIKAKAEELYKAKLKRDQEILDLVASEQKRTKRDFSVLAKKFIAEDKTVDDFYKAVATSDDFKALEVIGAGEENTDGGSEVTVEGVRGLIKGTAGERFIASEGYKAMRDRAAKKGRGAFDRNTSFSLDVNDTAPSRFSNAAAEPTSTGLTSIEKVPGVRGVLGLRRLTVRDLMDAIPTTATTIRYIREVSFTNEADMVAEAAAKPEALFEFSEVDAPVRKIAVYTKQPDEFIADYAAVAAYINNRLRYKVERKEEDELLNGSGSGIHLTGLLNTSGIQTQAKGTDTRADAIFKAMTNVRFGSGLAEGGWEADAIVLNPLDWENLRLAKDSNGQYYGGGPFTGAYGAGGLVMIETLWGKPCVITPAIAAGTALTGAFREAAEIRDKQGLTVEMTNSDQDDFVKNRITIRVERREALLVPVPTALCQVTGL